MKNSVNSVESKPKEKYKETSEKVKNLWKDPVYRAKQIASRKAKWQEPEYKKKMAKVRAVQFKTEEYSELRSSITKGLWEDKEYRDKTTQSIKLSRKDPEYIKKSKESIKISFETTDRAARQSSSLKAANEANPEMKELNSKRTKKLWEDEEYRKFQVESHKKYFSHPENREKASKAKIESLEKGVGIGHLRYVRGFLDCNLSSHLRYDSSVEKSFILWCNKHIANIRELHRSKFWLPYKVEGENNTRRYNPDFELITLNEDRIIVEVKCNWKFKEVNKDKRMLAKFDTLDTYCKDNNCYWVIITDTFFRQVNTEPSLPKKVLSKVGRKVQRLWSEEIFTDKLLNSAGRPSK